MELMPRFTSQLRLTNRERNSKERATIKSKLGPTRRWRRGRSKASIKDRSKVPSVSLALPVPSGVLTPIHYAAIAECDRKYAEVAKAVEALVYKRIIDVDVSKLKIYAQDTSSKGAQIFAQLLNQDADDIIKQGMAAAKEPDKNTRPTVVLANKVVNDFLDKLVHSNAPDSATPAKADTGAVGKWASKFGQSMQRVWPFSGKDIPSRLPHPSSFPDGAANEVTEKVPLPPGPSVAGAAVDKTARKDTELGKAIADAILDAKAYSKLCLGISPDSADSLAVASIQAVR
ncbi:hypothetical protein RJ55_01944 [Drechmeria coniospora]|nr:hypothetical protein RJ55_01944 [Drechmeria coniospora]